MFPLPSRVSAPPFGRDGRRPAANGHSATDRATSASSAKSGRAADLGGAYSTGITDCPASRALAGDGIEMTTGRVAGARIRRQTPPSAPTHAAPLPVSTLPLAAAVVSSELQPMAQLASPAPVCGDPIVNAQLQVPHWCIHTTS